MMPDMLLMRGLFAMSLKADIAERAHDGHGKTTYF